MTIIGNYVLHSDISIENSQECVLNKPESSLKFDQIEIEVNRIFKAFYTSIDFSPLVNFINKENAEFEALLKTDEVQQSITEQTSNSDKKPFSQRKSKYNLRLQTIPIFSKRARFTRT